MFGSERIPITIGEDAAFEIKATQAQIDHLLDRLESLATKLDIGDGLKVRVEVVRDDPAPPAAQ